MAAPASVNIANLSGNYVMNKNLSDKIAPMLEMQGIGFIMRKAIGMATITIHLRQFVGDDGAPRIETQNSGGKGGNRDARVLDWKPREHVDNVFGAVVARTHYAKTAAIQGDAALKEGWLDGEDKGPNGESHVESYVVNEDRGWETRQVWGFAMVDGERRHVRKVVCEKGGKKVVVRLVYDYAPYTPVS